MIAYEHKETKSLVKQISKKDVMKCPKAFLRRKVSQNIFFTVKALDNVNILIKKNEIHAICGENGAGKSTLMNIISGVYPYGSYEGQLFYEGKECAFKSIRESEDRGISIIHQQLALIPYLSIAENIFIGNEQSHNNIIDWDMTMAKAKEYMDIVGLKEDPGTHVMNIGVGKQQLVEICKAISRDVKLLILDEPTAALNDEESDKLLELLIKFKEQGITSILISHKLHELIKVSDTITIIRDGQVIRSLRNGVDKINENLIIKDMVGREITNRFPKRDSNIGNTLFEVKNWQVYDQLNDNRRVIKDVSFKLNKGEVLGFAGLMGAGRTELAMSIFGRTYGKKISGKLLKNGNEINVHNVSDAINNGIAYVSEDRHLYGLIENDSIAKNITLPNLKNFTKHLSLDTNKEILAAQKYREKLKIRSVDVKQVVSSLSGGNQQKVIFSKWVLSNADILILDEPTRGIDVGAKYEIYKIINGLIKENKSVIFISSDMTELLGMCDRIYVMNEGKIVGELEEGKITQENIMQNIMNDDKGENTNE